MAIQRAYPRLNVKEYNQIELQKILNQMCDWIFQIASSLDGTAEAVNIIQQITNISNITNNQTLIYVTDPDPNPPPNTPPGTVQGITGLSIGFGVVNGVSTVSGPIEYLDWGSNPQTAIVVSSLIIGTYNLTYVNGILTILT